VKRKYTERDIERRRSRRGRGRRKKEIEIRTETEGWKYINRERKKKESVSEEMTCKNGKSIAWNYGKGESKKEDKDTNEGEADGARGKEKSTEEGRSAECMEPKE
jgi:hypothetical protein